MELMQVIVKPYLTEKTFSVRNGGNKEVISFIVNPKATKNDIKRAFKLIYEIEVESVNTITRKSTKIKTGTRNPGFTKLMKIAYITLPAGVKLAVTQDEIESAQEEIKESKKEAKVVENADLTVKEKKVTKKEKSKEEN